MTDYSYTYDSRPELANQVLDDLLEVLARHEIEESLVRKLSVAVSEAFTNAVVHGGRSPEAVSVDVVLHVRESEVVADIVDHGDGGVARINARKPSSSMDEGGRGVDLIRHYADSCCFSEAEDGGLKVSIVFHRLKQEIT